MVFKIAKPHLLLQEFIQYYWILDGADTHVQKIIPDGFPEMIFHYGDDYFFNNGSDNKKQARAVAAGQLTRPIYIQASGRSGVIGVKFSPAGMWSLFNINVSHLTNDECPIEHLGINTKSVMDAFDAARDNTARIRALEQFFMHRLGSVKTFSGKQALLEIINSRGKISIGELSADLNISARKLQRIFKEAIGVSAKTYQRLVRFSNTYAMLQKGN